MIRLLDINVFCTHCNQRAPLRACSSEDNLYHDVYWPNNWMGLNDGHGFFSKCSFCVQQWPPHTNEYVYYGVLVVGPLTEQAIWHSPIKVGPKNNFQYNIPDNERFVGSSNMRQNSNFPCIRKRRHSTGNLGPGLSKWL